MQYIFFFSLWLVFTHVVYWKKKSQLLKIQNLTTFAVKFSNKEIEKYLTARFYLSFLGF